MILVGSFREDPSTVENGGSAYVFVRTSNVWSQVSKFSAHDVEAGDEFGRSVALSVSREDHFITVYVFLSVASVCPFVN